MKCRKDIACLPGVIRSEHRAQQGCAHATLLRIARELLQICQLLNLPSASLIECSFLQELHVLMSAIRNVTIPLKYPDRVIYFFHYEAQYTSKMQDALDASQQGFLREWRSSGGERG